MFIHYFSTPVFLKAPQYLTLPISICPCQIWGLLQVFHFYFFSKKENSFAFLQTCPLTSSGCVPHHSREAGLVHVRTQAAAHLAGKQASSDPGCAELMGEHPTPLHLRGKRLPPSSPPGPPPEDYVLPSAREENTPNNDSMTKLLPSSRDVGAADAVQVQSPQPHGVCGVCAHTCTPAAARPLRPRPA